jgi:hypothetical protein
MKILPQFKSPVKELVTPKDKLAHVHVDIVGPFPTSADGYRYLLTMIDRATRWPEAAMLKSITAAECADAFTSC